MTDSLGKCAVCGKEAGVLYPLLPREPAFCSKHHNPKDAGPFGCDFTGPDDFDIPISSPEWSPDCFDRDTFLWRDRQGCKIPLFEIDDRYLQNIINFLERKLPGYDTESASYWQAVVEFLKREQETRRREVTNDNTTKTL